MKKSRKSRTTLSVSHGEASGRASDQSQAEVIASIISKHQLRKGQREGKIHASSILSNTGTLRKRSSTKSSKIIHSRSDPSKGHVRKRADQSRTLQESSKFANNSLNQGRYGRKSSASKRSADKMARLLGSQGQSEVCKSEPKRTNPQRPPRKRQRKQKNSNAAESTCEDNICNNMARIKRRVKYLLTRVNLEQNYIDAYSAEGWKGQSREKIRPERELQRAKAQILQFQLGIRDAIQQLDSLGLQGTMKEHVFDSDGQIHHGDIFCAKCKVQDSGENNDIILCDGFCDRAFHQMCLVPPLETDNIPPEDEGWLCPVCECKMECLDVVNAYLGTAYSLDDHWQNIFAEAAAFASGDGKQDVVDDLLPSEDSEDEDYNPGANCYRDKGANLRLDGSGNESASDPSVEGEEDSDSNSDSNDEDYSKGSLLEELAGIMENGFNEFDEPDVKNIEDECALIDEDGVVVNEKRQRKEVDYKKLHDEMFGKSSFPEEASEDEEWGPSKRTRKARHPGQSSYNESNKEVKARGVSNGHESKSGRVCLPPDVVEKLREVFKENPLPSRACKEGLSKQLGLSFRKVHVWFRNVRAVALRKGLVQRSRARGRHSSKLIGKEEEELKNRDAMAKAKEKASEQWWLATMDMVNETEFKIERLKVLLQDTTRPDDYGVLMYVPVAELKERTSTSASKVG